MIVNLTPHTLTIVVGNATHEIQSSGLARVTLAAPEPIGAHEGIPLVRVATTGEVTGLPAPEPGVIYAVSRMVTDALPHRVDLVVPHDLIRDAEGRVVACRALALPAR